MGGVELPELEMSGHIERIGAERILASPRLPCQVELLPHGAALE